MEYWDAYNVKREKLDLLLERGGDVPPGVFRVITQLWPINSRGEILLQRRSFECHRWPGQWSATGGSVMAGETSLQAAMREAREELALTLDAEKTFVLCKYTNPGIFADVYLSHVDVEVEQLVFQPEEVMDACWFKPEDIESLTQNHTMHRYCYLTALVRFAQWYSDMNLLG